MPSPRNSGPRAKVLREADASRATPPAVPTTIGPALTLTMQLVLAARQWRSLLDDRLRPLGQSAARMEAMSSIAYAPAGTSQIAIARRIGIEGATLTRMLDSLETDGLVERSTDPADRRNKHLALTPAGEAAFREICAVAEALRALLLDELDGGEIGRANAFLAVLLQRMDTGLPAPE